MDKQASRFLDAYNEIDKWLRKILKADKRMSFYNLVEDASNPKKVPPQHAGVVGYYKDDLKGYGDLRNAIVHEHRNDEVIATPHLKAVEELETIRKRLLRSAANSVPFYQNCSAMYSRRPHRDSC